MMYENQKTILVDLDGVLNAYNGNYDKNFIPPLRDGAFNFIKNLSETYKVVIFTSRNLLLAAKWISENKLETYIDNITNIKEPNFLIVDDRCINFNGNYSDTINQINNFQVWYKNSK